VRAKVENALKHKAAGVLVISDPQGGGRGGRSFFSMRDGDPFKVPVATLRRDWAERMLIAAGTDLAAIEKDIDATLKPRSLPLTGWTCRLQTDVAHTQITVKNVVGVVEGVGPLAKETVVIGAHYDHVGMGSGSRFGGFGGSNAVSGPGAPGGVGFPLSEMGVSAIHRGADDNASGTCALIEIARRFGGDKGREGRRLVFIAFTAEESGLLGSAYYCRNPIFPLQDTVAMINMDMVGRLQDNRLMVGGVGSAKPFLDLIDKLNEKHRFDLLKEPSGQGPSDHASFYAQKVPVFKFFTGFHEQYHRPTDRVETLNVPGLRRVADLVGDVAVELRTLPARPEYVKTGGFNRTTTLYSSAPSTGFVPDYADTKEGVLLEDVVRNSVAAKAGLKKGDRIVAVDGKPIKDAAALLTLTRNLKPGTKVELTVERDGKTQPIPLQLARAPAGQADARFGYYADFTDLKDGILLTEVPENSPAGKAGLKKGDRLVTIAGEMIPDRGTYLGLMQTLQAGEKVAVTVLRDGKQQQFEVQVAESSRTPTPAGRFGILPNSDDNKEGVLVAEVRSDTPAAAAGVRKGDRVTAVNGQPVKDVTEYTQALRGLRDGDKVELTIVRDGQTLKVQTVFK
jgi:S1-C subfamily serine protease